MTIESPTATAVSSPPIAVPEVFRRVRWLAVARICFGVIWLVDAAMKWSPQFTSSFLGDVSGQELGQPAVVKSWLRGWVSLLSHGPHVFAHAVAVAESLVALGLIFGALTNLTCIGGAILSLLIWSTAEGFGGPYDAGSTDVGTSIVYVVVFALLLISGAGGWASLDQWLRDRFGFLCARPVAGLPGPSRRFVVGFGLLAAFGLAMGLVVAFADVPMPPGMSM